MSESISDLRIAELLSVYGVATSLGLAGAIRTYISMLLRWNSKISLTTVVDPVEILKFHFGESLFAMSKVPISFGRLADVGSGAGFPGLPLGMFLPDLEVVLIESNLKKTTFLSEIIRELNMGNITVRRERFENLVGNEFFDFVTARALGHYDELLKWSRHALKSDGKAILWLGERDSGAIPDASGWNFAAPIPIPQSERRVFLVGTPQMAAK